MTFQQLSISEPLLKAIADKQYATPTPIQEKAIPTALTGRDILGTAQTGTGKTAAFAIPILQQICNAEPTDSGHAIKALILTPTRELAIQIDEDIRDYGKYCPLRRCVIYGGVKQKQQTERLRRGADILTATPGRLLDLIGQGFVDLTSVRHFVLDEADRMLDMGFIQDVKRLLLYLPAKRQTMLFSATMPPAIAALGRAILKNPVRIETAPPASVVDTIGQQVYFVEKQQRKDLLVSLLKKEDLKSVLVFARTKHGADKISGALRRAGIHSVAIHGDKSQRERQQAMSLFKSGKARVMIATDIASRGLDFEELSMVINYDLPDAPETYVHRIGRTGRAGHVGKALTFCSQEEHMIIRDIQKLIGTQIEAVLV